MRKPLYVFGAWHETTMWVIAVDDVLHDGSDAALHAATQVPGYHGVEAMARDLVATLLDVEYDSFDVKIRHDLKPPADLQCRCPCAGCRYDCRLHRRGSNRRARRTGLIIRNSAVDVQDPDGGEPRREIRTTGYFGRAPRRIARLARYYEGLADDEAHHNPVPRPKLRGVRHTRTARRA